MLTDTPLCVAVAPGLIVDADYLTPGKRYPILKDAGDIFQITDDAGDDIWCAWEDCAHLSTGKWTREAATLARAGDA